MKNLVLTTVVVLCASVAVMAQAPATAEKPVSGVVALSEAKLTVTVEAIDLAKRMLTVKDKEGTTETFEVDPAVKNLDQVKKGDRIVLAYHESLVWELNKPGAASPGVVVAGGIETAKPGETPGGVAAQQVTATVTITKIDPTVPSVTFKGPKGNERTVKVKDPAKLALAKVGDTVDITYTEAVAIALEKAEVKK